MRGEIAHPYVRFRCVKMRQPSFGNYIVPTEFYCDLDEVLTSEIDLFALESAGVIRRAK